MFQKCLTGFKGIVWSGSTILQYIGAGILALMMHLTFFDVALRYLFNRPIMGSFDITGFMMAIIVAFGLAYCGIKKGHVTVELLVERFPQKVQNVIGLINNILGFVIFGLLTWQSFVNMQVQFNTHAASSVLFIPLFPFMGIIGIGFALLALVFLVNFINSLYPGENR